MSDYFLRFSGLEDAVYAGPNVLESHTVRVMNASSYDAYIIMFFRVVVGSSFFHLFPFSRKNRVSSTYVSHKRLVALQQPFVDQRSGGIALINILLCT